ncbi:hypothetical protein BWU74_02025 [Paraburkholderia caledonica]|nr:hypothetical protein BWU74_02025 [Burkholderia sp. Bk]
MALAMALSIFRRTGLTGCAQMFPEMLPANRQIVNRLSDRLASREALFFSDAAFATAVAA